MSTTLQGRLAALQPAWAVPPDTVGDGGITHGQARQHAPVARGPVMGKVISHMTMSLDGFIAGPDDDPGELFDWYQAGDVAVEHANPDLGAFHVDAASAETLADLLGNAGALISG